MNDITHCMGGNSEILAQYKNLNHFLNQKGFDTFFTGPIGIERLKKIGITIDGNQARIANQDTVDSPQINAWVRFSRGESSTYHTIIMLYLQERCFNGKNPEDDVFREILDQKTSIKQLISESSSRSKNMESILPLFLAYLGYNVVNSDNVISDVRGSVEKIMDMSRLRILSTPVDIKPVVNDPVLDMPLAKKINPPKSKKATVTPAMRRLKEKANHQTQDQESETPPIIPLGDTQVLNEVNTENPISNSPNESPEIDTIIASTENNIVDESSSDVRVTTDKDTPPSSIITDTQSPTLDEAGRVFFEKNMEIFNTIGVEFGENQVAYIKNINDAFFGKLNRQPASSLMRQYYPQNGALRFKPNSQLMRDINQFKSITEYMLIALGYTISQESKMNTKDGWNEYFHSPEGKESFASLHIKINEGSNPASLTLKARDFYKILGETIDTPEGRIATKLFVFNLYKTLTEEMKKSIGKDIIKNYQSINKKNSIEILSVFFRAIDYDLIIDNDEVLINRLSELHQDIKSNKKAIETLTKDLSINVSKRDELTQLLIKTRQEIDALTFIITQSEKEIDTKNQRVDILESTAIRVSQYLQGEITEEEIGNINIPDNDIEKSITTPSVVSEDESEIPRENTNTPDYIEAGNIHDILPLSDIFDIGNHSELADIQEYLSDAFMAKLGIIKISIGGDSDNTVYYDVTSCNSGIGIIDNPGKIYDFLIKIGKEEKIPALPRILQLDPDIIGRLYVLLLEYIGMNVITEARLVSIKDYIVYLHSRKGRKEFKNFGITFRDKNTIQIQPVDDPILSSQMEIAGKHYNERLGLIVSLITSGKINSDILINGNIKEKVKTINSIIRAFAEITGYTIVTK